MGFLTTQDRIGNVSYSSGIITLQPSLLTIGGQQYRTPTLNVSLSGLTANTLYMVYVVMTGPTSFQLVVSGNYNSTGPAGYTKWKLVRSFISDGITGSVSLGTLFDPYLPTVYDWVPYTTSVTASSGSLTNFSTSCASRREGSKGFLQGLLSFNGAPGTWQYPRFSSPSNMTMSNNGLGFYRSQGSFNDTGSNSYGARIFIGSNYIEMESLGGSSGAAMLVSNTSPFAWAATDSIMFEVGPISISGWNNTPIAYL